MCKLNYVYVVSICMCAGASVCVCVCVCVCRIVSTDMILHFVNTLIIIIIFRLIWEEVKNRKRVPRSMLCIYIGPDFF